MIVCIEGCIGVGKTTLTKKLTEAFGGQSIFEEFENNPFLKDFYNTPDVFGFHVQSTFLCLQSKQFLKAEELAKSGNVFLDFHPIKSKIFSDIIVKDKTAYTIIHQIYGHLFETIEPEILIIYLHASAAVIMNRIKQRADEFTTGISLKYIEEVIDNYDAYFKKYKHPLISIDTNAMDFEKNSADWLLIKEKVKSGMNKK
ncbi:MAG: deoxynucleoside kinase [Ferruginibacter sp.]